MNGSFMEEETFFAAKLFSLQHFASKIDLFDLMHAAFIQHNLLYTESCTAKCRQFTLLFLFSRIAASRVSIC